MTPPTTIVQLRPERFMTLSRAASTTRFAHFLERGLGVDVPGSVYAYWALIPLVLGAANNLM